MIILIGGEVLKRKKAKQLKDVNYVITRFYDLLYTLKDLSLQSEQAYRKNSNNSSNVRKGGESDGRKNSSNFSRVRKESHFTL